MNNSVYFSIHILLILVFLNRLDAQNFAWARSVGGDEFESGRSITADFLGNVYVTGYFNGTVDFDPGIGELNITTKGDKDFFIQKFDRFGNFLWVKTIGGVYEDDSRDIAVDQWGNIFLTGFFQGTVDFDPGKDIFNLTVNSSENAVFVLKLDTNGNLLWAHSFKGRGYSITVDYSGNVLTTGYFWSTVDFDFSSGVNNVSPPGGARDIYILKLDGSGTLIWVKAIGSPSVDEGWEINTDNNNNVYTGGFFNDQMDFDPGPNIYTLSPTIKYDLFVLKLDVLGNFVWAHNIGGTGINLAKGIAVDYNQNVYTVGTFENVADFDPSDNTFYLESQGKTDIFIQKLDASGNFIWAGGTGSEGWDNCADVALDKLGNIYLTGSFSNTVDFDFGPGIHNLTGIGGNDIFIQKLNASGELIWVESISSIGGNGAASIFVDSLNSIYTTGVFTLSADFDPDENEFILNSKGGTADIFAMKWNQCNIDVSVSSNDPDLIANFPDANYQWLDCDDNYSIIEGATSQIFTPQINGNYAVEIGADNCVDTSSCYLITSLNSNVPYFKKIQISPNPVKNQLTVDLGYPEKEWYVKIFNIKGQQILSSHFNQIRIGNIDFNEPSGIYILRLYTKKFSKTFKIVASGK